MPVGPVTMTVRTGDHAGVVDPSTVWGLYVVFSDRLLGVETETPAFRIGVSGVTATSTLRKRLTTHARGWTSDNWTTKRRRWRPVWTVEVPMCTSPAILMAEHALYAAMARRFVFENSSGFFGNLRDVPDVIRTATSALDGIAATLGTQLGVAEIGIQTR